MTRIDDYKALLEPLSAEDQLILCGGDGTLNRFINDTDGIDIKCRILYYAIGTGNDFLHDLGKKVGDAPFPINEYLKDLPFVEVNGKKYRYLNGIDGYCCEVGDQLKAKSDKPVNYTAIAIKGLLFHYKPKTATVTVDGKRYTYKKAWIAATMKGRYYGGGMKTAPDQNRLDEKGEVTLVVMYGKGKLKTLTVFPSIFKGEHIKHTEMVAVHTGKEISVTFDQPCALQIDGETVLNVSGYRVTAEQKSPVTV
ncbi:MAG: diacylglycerol kinase family protein [Clostridia bacterium]|nr:diacylglycerol kinase family protein [Clostridia bacterium]